MIVEKPARDQDPHIEGQSKSAVYYTPNELELELYQQYRPQFELHNKLNSFNTTEKIASRQDFWRNVTILLERLSKIDALFKAKRVTNPNLQNRVEVFEKAIASLKHRKEQYQPLNEHLHTTTQYASKLIDALIEKVHQNKSKLATTDRQLELIATPITPLHDIIKHLGELNSQISTDHQVVIQHIVTTFSGFFQLNPAETNFAAAVIGRHENAEDLTRLQLLQDFKAQNQSHEPNDPELAIIHGQIIFYLIDTFTNVIEPDENQNYPNQSLRLNPKALTERFRDILERWNDPAITPYINPKWALTAYHDYEVALELLEQGGLSIPPDAKLAVIDSAIQSFRDLLVTFDVRKRDNEMVGAVNKEMKPLPTADRDQFLEVIVKLEELAAKEKQNQKATTIALLSNRLENLMTSLATSQNSIGSRLTKIVQTSYETATRNQFQPEILEVDDQKYQELAPEYRAFNIIAVSAALNLVHYYLQTPMHQGPLLEFFKQKRTGEPITVEEILNHPILNQLSQKLAEHLHNQYELSLGDQKHWWRELDHGDGSRSKKEKSVIVATQILLAVCEYLSQTQLRKNILFNYDDKQKIRKINLTNQTSTLETWLSNSLREETILQSEASPTPAIELTARATHQFWLKAKQARHDGDLPMETKEIDEDVLPVKKRQENIILDPALHPFDELHPQIKKKSYWAAQIALENLVADLANETTIDKPLSKLAKLIAYLSAMITTNDNSSTHRTWETQNSELVTWADLLTSRQYETWLMHRLAKENGLSQLNELASLDYFSLWLEKDEKTPFATILGEPTHSNIHLSSRDLDRIPLLMAAITLYLHFYFYLINKQSSYLSTNKHREDLRKVLSIAELVAFPNLGEIYQKLEVI
jgi:hypothetical protein